jgi:hypothetical protein
MASGRRRDHGGAVGERDDSARDVVAVRQALDDDAVAAELRVETAGGRRRSSRARCDEEHCDPDPNEGAAHWVRGRAAPKNRPASLLTKPIRSYIASSVGSDAFRAFSAPRASSRWSSAGSERSSL